ncbi:MAG: hypothetical protein M3R43_10235 [Acidobacteriota bacterium]|nr:hypothetical protein [Acidobacteriota bacterium]
MFERYTEDALRVIFFARYEASLVGSSALEPEHLWLGLLRQTPKLVRRVAPQITAESIHQRLMRRGPKADRVSMTTDIPLSDDAQRALASATAEADGHGQQHITAEYLALALLREGNISSQYLLTPPSR